MKTCRWLCILLALCLLTGCIRKTVPQPNPQPTEQPAEPAPQSAPEPERTSAPEPEPEPEPRPKPAPMQEPEDILNDLTAEQRQTLNVFLSNFSEAPFTDFDRDADNDTDALVNFAYLHYKINSFGRDKIELRRRGDESYYTISAADVDACLYRFLGVHLEEEGSDYDWRFYFPAADGESYNTFTVVNRLLTDGSGRYQVEFDVYDLDILAYFDGGSSIDASYYALTAQEAAANSLLEYRGSGTATLEDYTYNDSASYRLITYDDPLR